MAAARQPHAGVRWRDAFALRCGVGAGQRGAAVGRPGETVRNLAPAKLPATQALRAGCPGRSRVAQGAQAGRVHGPKTSETAVPAGSAVPLLGGHLARGAVGRFAAVGAWRRAEPTAAEDRKSVV